MSPGAPNLILVEALTETLRDTTKEQERGPRASPVSDYVP